MNKTIVERLIDAKLADNEYHASGRLNVLKCYELKTDEERLARCQLYKDWLLAGENKPVARLMAIAGKPAPAQFIDGETVTFEATFLSPVTLPCGQDMFAPRYCPKCENEVAETGNGIYDCKTCENILFESETDRHKGETKGKPDTLPCGHDISEVVQADEGTAYCGACVREDEERDKSRLELYQRGEAI